MRSTLAPLAWLGLLAPLHAQGFLADHLTELDGLPSSVVYDVEVADDGAVWFATRAGLARYDGLSWEVQGPDSGLDASGGLHLVALGPDGVVWATEGSMQQRLLCLRGGAWENLGPLPADLEAGSLVELVAVRDPRGVGELLALGHDGRLLWRTEAGWGVVAAGVHGLAVDGDEILLATDRGLERYGPGGTTAPVDVPGLGPVRDVDVERLDDGGRRLWLLGPDWLGRYEAGRLTIEVEGLDLGARLRVGPPKIRADGEAGVYVGTYHELLLWDRGRLRSLDEQNGLVSGGASDMALDGHGNVWITTLRGVSRIPPRAWEYLDEDSGLLESEVTSLEFLGDGRLVAGHNGGLSLMGPEGIEHVELFVQQGIRAQLGRVLDLEPDGRGGLWLAASDQGLAHLSADGELKREGEHQGVALGWLGSPAVGVVRDDRGGLWTLTTDGATRRIDGVPTPIDVGPERLYLRRGVASPDRRTLYLCTSNLGLLKVEDGRAEVVPGSTPGEDNVFGVLFPGEGPALVGTMDGLRVLGDERLEPAPAGLDVDAAVYSLLEDSFGSIWLGTSRGVYRWDGHDLTHFTLEDGLVGLEANRDALLELADGRIAVGTSHGLALFDPAREWFFERPRATVLEATSSAPDWRPGDPVLAGSDLVFQVALASFAGRAKPQLRYRILGEQAWSEPIPAPDGELRFPSLEAGPFAIEVQARHARGDWGPVVASPTVEVQQVFWRTGWYLALRLLVIAAFLGVGTALFLRGRQARRLEAELARRTRALQRTELRFERLFALNPAAQFLVEPDGGWIRHHNGAARRLLNEAPGAAPVRTLAEALERLGAVPAPAELERVLDGLGGRTQLELTGSAIGRELELRSSRFAMGQEERVLVTLVDVSARRQLEERVRQAQSLQAVGELAGGLAHDFNNLLTAILGQVELLRLEVAGRGSEQLDAIQGAGHRGAALVRKLLAFGKRQPLNPEVIDLGPAVAEVVATLDDLLGEHVHLEADLGEPGQHVRVDPVEIERVVLNLCLNARDAMPQGGVIQVSVEARPELDGAPLGWVCLTVSDEGIGLTPEVRERMFEPFYTTKADPTGAGLGLASVHGVVGQSDGHVEADGAPGEGTEIRVLLPRVEAPTDPPPPGPLPAEERDLGLRVLLVEDQLEVRRAVASFLRGLGCVPVEAAGGAEALARLARDPEAVDLVLTDVMMPGMDGLELGEQLAVLYPDLPLVYMSGYQDLTERAPEAPFLAKPFTVGTLRAALRSARDATTSP